MLIVYIRSALAHFVSQKQNSSHFAACCRLLRIVYVLGFGLPVMWPLFLHQLKILSHFCSAA